MTDCIIYFGAYVFIGLSYVSFIYAFDDRSKSKNHPDSVKKRFAAVFCSNILAVLLTYFLLHWNYDSPFYQMGFRSNGLFFAAFFSSFLTLCVYIGSLVEIFIERSLTRFYTLRYWSSCLDLVWIKYTFVGPISEEITFRACCAVLLNHCFGRHVAIFLSPFFFAISHFHHVIDDLKEGSPFTESIADRAFQVIYSYLFGVYATFLFFLTGHIIAPIISHAICNNFGLPNIFELNRIQTFKKRIIVLVVNLIGLSVWFYIFMGFIASLVYV